MKTWHCIQKQVFELTLHEEERAKSIQERLSGYYKQDILSALEASMDEIIPENEVWKVDLMELDLGLITEEKLFDADFIRLITEELRKELSKWKSNQLGQSSKIVHIQDDFYNQWLFFLRYGTYSWQHKKYRYEAIPQILEIIATQPQAVATLLKLFKTTPNAVDRLIFQHSYSFLQQIIRAITGDDFSHWSVLIQELVKLDRTSSRFHNISPSIPTNTVRNILLNAWRYIFNYVTTNQRVPSLGLFKVILEKTLSNTKHLQGIYAYLQLNSAEYSTLIRYFNSSVDNNPASLNSGSRGLEHPFPPTSSFPNSKPTRKHISPAKESSTQDFRIGLDETRLKADAPIGRDENNLDHSDNELSNSLSQDLNSPKDDVSKISNPNKIPDKIQPDLIEGDEDLEGSNSEEEKKINIAKEALERSSSISSNTSFEEEMIPKPPPKDVSETSKSNKFPDKIQPDLIKGNKEINRSISEEEKEFNLDKETSEEPSSNSLQTTPGEEVISSLTSVDRENLPLGELYINHAGLVLVHPYLYGFFNNLGLLQGKQFKSVFSQSKAIHLLHYLACGELNPEEHELGLAKILCAYPLSKPIEKEIYLDPKELEEVEYLLEDVIKNWGALGKASPDGLREGFLGREGKLTQLSNGWKVWVERKGIDILLDRLPWGMGIIMLPWTEQMLQVEWR